MAPQNPRRRRLLAESESEDEAETDNESASSQNSGSSKRRRIDRRDASTSQTPPRSPLLPNGYLAEPRTSSLGTYQPGSIVRVKLTNFVTYTSAEFFPGPSLNMVIGPNGTGKSTLVCAICLGLGWGPQHLGRAKDVGEFVKHGCREATIEIELAADQRRQRRNPVIQRVIKREGNKSNFFIDTRPAPQKGVLELARSFAIQIDNLCQFLPQDKVVEFAALTPVELLNSTQRAAAPEEMIDWHEELKRLRAEQKLLQSRQTSDKETLSGMVSRQETQRADVERMNEREALEKKVEMLEKARPIPAYREARLAYNEAKQKKRDAQADLNILEAEVEPALRAVNAKQVYRDQVERAAKERRRVVDRMEAMAEDRRKKYKDIEEQVDNIGKEIDAEVKGHQTRNQEAKNHVIHIQRLENQLRERPEEFDVASFNEQIREKTRAMRDIDSSLSEMGTSQRTLGYQLREQHQRSAQFDKEIKDLDSQAGQQARILQSFSRDTYQAWKWIQSNQDKFEKQIYGPPIIECAIKDQRYANRIESLLQRSDMISFTCQTNADFKILQETCYKQLKLSEINIRTSKGQLNRFRPPMSEQDAQRLRIDGWAIDYITGPDAILSLLCSENKFHMTAMVDGVVGEELYEKLERSNLSIWVDRTHTYRVSRRREYGPNAVSTQVRDVRPARAWANQTVDSGLRGELEQKKLEAEHDAHECKNALNELAEKQKVLKQKQTEHKREKENLEMQKAAKQKALAEFRAIPNKIQQMKDKLDIVQEAISAYRNRVQDLHDKQDELVLREGRLALQYAEMVQLLQDRHNDLLQAEIILIEARSDYDILSDRNQEIKENLETRRREVQQITKESDKASERARTLLVQCNDLLAGVDDETKAFLTSCSEHSVEDHEAEIDSGRAQLQMVQTANPHLKDEFNRRARKISALEHAVEERDARLVEFEARISELKAKWEPRLDELVAQISRAFGESFEKIGCAGEVSVYKDDDFDQWAIQIQVKFREHEQLSILDSHRQSGGERAVSTIFYLMALQSLARAPFRVVDEINQGMDPRNERMVHERMVNIACQEHTSQYFLITPKLLHDLRYHERMRVQCIVSGEQMPKDYRDLDFRKCVEIARAVKAA